MPRYVAKRVISLIPTAVGVSIAIFLMIRLIPGTVVEQMLGTEAMVTQAQIEALRAFFGLDKPIYIQYLIWFGKIIQADFGTSWRTGAPVLQMILERLTVTGELALGALIISILIGIPFGVISAVRENTRLDHVVRVVSLFSLSVPIFWQAAMLILVLSLRFKWTPPANYTSPLEDLGANLTIMFFPCLVLGTTTAAQIMRMTRASLLDVMRKDYIRTARAKGLSEVVIVSVHGLKNAMIPIITIIGVQIGYLLGGAVVTEEVFTLPGVGRLMLSAVYQRDYPVVQGTVLFIAILFMFSNLIVDLAYSYLDPRIHYE